MCSIIFYLPTLDWNKPIQTTQASRETYSTKHQEVQNLFKSNEDKTAKDAIWASNYLFKVGALNDGTDRAGMPHTSVRFCTITVLKEKKYWYT